MNDYFIVKDICRKGLINHLEKACKKLPKLKNLNILDIGCGTGVPTIWFAENFYGNITAIDNDSKAIEYLRRKTTDKNLQDRIKVTCTSFYDFTSKTGQFDIILAEGFLNIVGFNEGFVQIAEILKSNGFLVIHDEFKDHEIKLELIKKHNFTIIDTQYLDENIWWNEYYMILERAINKIRDPEIRKLFNNDIKEINLIKTSPALFQSIYYVVKKL